MSSKIRIKFYRRTDVKMTLWYILTFFLSVLAIGGFLYVRMKHQLIKEVDRFLLDETKELSEVLTQQSKGVEGLKNFEIKEVARTYYPIYFRVLDSNGISLYVSKGFKEMEYGVNEKVISNARDGKDTRESIHSPGRRRPFRIISSPFHVEGRLVYIIQTGTHLHFVRKSLSNFKYNIMASLPIVILLGGLGGWILARKSLSPIGYITSKAQSITSRNLGDRLTPRGTDDELDGLIRTINGMISRLGEAFNRMAEFTADASHELKTPICALKGEAEVLLSKERHVEEYKEGLAHFIVQFEHMNRMINDLILLSKFDSSQAGLKVVPLRLDLLVKDICNLFKILTDQKDINLIIEPLPEIMVMGDKVLLQQLFTNLIDNAIKYTQKGSIRITVEKNNGNALVKIKDTGIGISKEEQKNIFKRFYRVDKSRSKETGGVGLGLSIAEWIAHAHQGRIEVDSELNKGSTFTVYLRL